jgi:ferrous iron transport protein B
MKSNVSGPTSSNQPGQGDAQSSPRVLLAGSPNSGKSTLFNQLTGMRQRVANYPGVTVELSEGKSLIDGQWHQVIDLPGTSSLNTGSPDERIAIDCLTSTSDRETVMVNVIEAARPNEGLTLAWQMAAFGHPQVIVLNFIDEAEKRGVELDAVAIQTALGCPVVLTDSIRGRGIEELRLAISRARVEHCHLQPFEYPESVDKAADAFAHAMEKETGSRPSLPLARRALLDARSCLGEDCWDSLPRQQALEEGRKAIWKAGLHPYVLEARISQERLKQLRQDEVLPAQLPAHFHPLDRVFLHPLAGPVVFLVIMALLFQSIYTWAGPAMDGIEIFFGWLGGVVGELLSGFPMLQGLVADGVIGGVGSVVVFLPQIVILYALITVLEDVGYLSRAALLSDKLFSWCGMSGRSFVPLLSGFACAIPAIMATRTINSRSVRHTTAMLAPMMSCSARLPVYVIIIGVLIEPRFGAFWAGISLLVCHLMGAVTAMAAAWLWQRVRRGKIATTGNTLLMEIPPLRRPKVSNIWHRVYTRALDFLKTAGTVILAVSILIWAAATFPQVDELPAGAEAATVEEYQFEQSYLARAGKAIQPVFDPAGFDWKLTVGVVASLPAREVIVATLGTIYGIADADEEHPGLRKALANDTWTDGPRAGQPVLTLASGLAVIVFFAFCMQCWATVAVLWRELGVRPAAYAFFGYTAFAWLAAVATYQITAMVTGIN